MIETQYKCSCGAVKQKTNHWWLLFKLPSGAIKVQPWNDMRANKAGAQHICGQNCLNRALSEWMNMQHSNVIPPWIESLERSELFPCPGPGAAWGSAVQQ